MRSTAKRALSLHVPVGRVGKPLFASLYRLHVVARESIGWATRFIWYEPLFRSQCERIGSGFSMEQLPYLLGRGELRIGNDVRLSGKPSIQFSSRYVSRPRLQIGDGCFVGHNVAITIGDSVEIGNHCLIAGGVRISDFDGHPMDAMKRRDDLPADRDQVQPVMLGNDVWIGHSAVILKGVRIGDRAIVGARAVVTRDVPADATVVGNPARVIRSREAA